MPCGCFGRKKPRGEPCPAGKEGVPSGWSVFTKKSGKGSKNHDVSSSFKVDDCALESQRVDSRSPSSFVDSPYSDSRIHTQSTLPVLASSVSSQSSVGSSSSFPVALCRAELEEKRKDFFKDLYQSRPPQKPSINVFPDAAATLPAIVRARQFGEVKSMRPVSQPVVNLTQEKSILPPGPHLLHACSTSRTSLKSNKEDEEQCVGFNSPAFLRELKAATAGLSERWALAEEKRQLKLSNEILASITEVNDQSPDTNVITPSGNDTQKCSGDSGCCEMGSIAACSVNSSVHSLSSNPSSCNNDKFLKNTQEPELMKMTDILPPENIRKYMKENHSPSPKTEDEVLNELSKMEVPALFKKGSIDIYEMPEIVIDPSPESDIEEEIITSEDFEIDLQSLSAHHLYTFETSPHNDDTSPKEPVDLLKLMEKMSSEEDIAFGSEDEEDEESTADTIITAN